jgi:hypothetical protein
MVTAGVRVYTKRVRMGAFNSHSLRASSAFGRSIPFPARMQRRSSALARRALAFSSTYRTSIARASATGKTRVISTLGNCHQT